MDKEFQNDMDLLDAHAAAAARTKDRQQNTSPASLASLNDFEDELEFRTIDGIQRTADRYIWFPGQLMEPRLLRSRPDFATLGGEYFGTEYPALGLSKFALFRARITPVTLRPRAIPVDEKIVNKEIEAFTGQRLANGETVNARVQFVKTFPGDQLETIVFGARDGNEKGYIELTGLQGKTYKELETKQLVNDLQLAIFPEWIEILRGEAKLPKTLRGLVATIEAAKHKWGDNELLVGICDEMLASCDTFRLWGVGYLQSEGVRIRHGVHEQGGYVHRYSPVAELLLEQLEMKRENLLDQADSSAGSAAAFAAAAASMAETAKANAEAAQANQVFLQKILENQQTLGAGLPAGAVTEPKTQPVTEQKAEQKPVQKPK